MTRVALFVGLFVALAAGSAHAVPSTVAFTGRLKTSAGPVTGSVDLTFKIFSVATGGTALWTEAHPGVGADQGLVFADLGSLTTLDTSILDGGAGFLEITVGTETLTPRLPLESVPYAIRTGLADDATKLGGTIGASDVVTTVTPAAPVSATKTGNTVSIGLAACTSGQIYKFSGGTWGCAADANTTYTAGAGVSISGTTISGAYTGSGGVAVTGAAISLATTGCMNGFVWKFNGSAFTCAAEQSYAAGTGLTLTSNTFAVNTNAIQARVSGSCPAGQAIRAIDAAGGVTCNSGAPSYLTLVSSTSVAANSFAALNLQCPAGWIATGGGVDNNNVLNTETTSTGPTVNGPGGNGTRMQINPDQQYGPATGWQGSMTNPNASTGLLKVGVICTQ